MPRIPQLVLVWLAIASFLAQGTGAMALWGVVRCIGCGGGADRIAFACSPAQESRCCDDGLAAAADPQPEPNATTDGCGCVDVPVKIENLPPTSRMTDLPADLRAPLPCPGFAIPSFEPAIRRSPGVCCNSPPRQLIPSSRSTVLII